MKIAIVDDEADCQAEMESLLKHFGAENGLQMEITSFSGGEAFLDAARQERFDIVFMDIYMEGLDGMRAAVRLRKTDRQCVLIFLTSSEEHFPDAFSVHAFEYILKPLVPQRVYDILRDALAILPPESRYIEVTSERKIVRLFLHTIVSAVADAHYLNIGLADGSVVRSRMTIRDFLRMAEDAPGFISVNKGIVLNADYITQFEANCCLTENGGRFPVRVRDRAQLERAGSAYHFEAIRSWQRVGQGRRDAP